MSVSNPFKTIGQKIIVALIGVRLDCSLRRLRVPVVDARSDRYKR